jgi:2-polyprenyl-6-methoxyphenol hydroxylase-like FAD-dependent oxidoreductase
VVVWLLPQVTEQISMSTLLGRRAVVIGAGIGGLSAAGALAGCFEQVDVLERSRLPRSAKSRSGTPQDRHPHGLLAGGLKALGEIFPDFDRDLAEAGAVPVRVAQDLRYERPDVGAMPQRDFGLEVLCASRPLVELVLRRRAEAISNISIRPKCRVTEIVPAKNGATVHGVQFEGAKGRSETVAADLVVDASGRGTLTLALIDALGWPRPEETTIGVDISYATAVVRMPTDATPWKIVVTLPDPPALSLNAVLLPAEENQWMVLIATRGATPRLETWDAFLGALERLITPTLYNVLRHVEAPDCIRHYRFPASLWRHYERLPGLPRGVLPVADGFCRFNPIHGQGMAVAAQQAHLLQTAIAQAASGPHPIAALQASFMAAVTDILQSPWSMSTSADLAFPSTRGPRPDKFAESLQFEAALFRAAVSDAAVHRALIEVFSLLEPPSRLEEPDILQRVEAVAGNKPTWTKPRIEELNDRT